MRRGIAILALYVIYLVLLNRLMTTVSQQLQNLQRTYSASTNAAEVSQLLTASSGNERITGVVGNQ